MKNLPTQFAALVLSTLCFLTGAYGQTDAASSTSTAPSSSNAIERRLDQLHLHPAQATAAKQSSLSLPLPSSSSFVRADQSPLERLTRAHAAHQPSAQSQRLPGAPVAAERYVFGRMDLATGNDPDAVALGAFQTGGPQSMAVANYSDNTVSVLLANPDGTFQAQTVYAVGSEPDAIAEADFNHDGNLDLAVAGWGAGTVSILLGNGDGTLQPQVA